MIYFFVYILIVVLAFYADNLRKKEVSRINIDGKLMYKGSPIILFLIGSILLLLAGLRFYVGTDYGTYMNLQIPETLSGMKNVVEFGYSKIIFLGASMGNFQWIFVITHLIIIFFIMMALWKSSISYGWSIFLLCFGTFFNFSMSGMRQSIAGAIFLFSLYYLFNKKIINYIILIFFAFLFHKSALVFLPLIIFRFIPFKKSYYVAIIISGYILRFLVPGVLLFIFNNLGFYEGYLTTTLNSTGTSKTFLISIIPITFMILCINFRDLKDNKEQEIIGVLSYIQAISVIVVLYSTIIPQYERIFYMFSFSNIILIGYLFKNISSSLRNKISIAFIIIYLIVFLQIVMLKGGIGTYPYRSILNIYKDIF